MRKKSIWKWGKIFVLEAGILVPACSCAGSKGRPLAPFCLCLTPISTAIQQRSHFIYKKLIEPQIFMY
jgi:hypothetical protein